MNAAKLAVTCAILMGSGTAFAQASSVTLYGIIDTDITYLNHQSGANGHSASQWSMASAGEYGSRFGMRGYEDLGGGYGALFDLEQGFNAANGNANDSSRQFARLSYVGLSTPYGKVTLGRQYSAYFDTIDPFAPQNRSVTFEPYKLMMNDYIDNSLKYTVRYRGLTFAGMAALGGAAGNFRSSATYSVGVRYAMGPLLLGVAADQSNTAASTVAPIGSVGEVQRIAAGARYQVGNATVFAGYKWQLTQSASQITTQRDDVYWTGVRYMFRPDIETVLAYYYQNLKYVRGQDLANPEQLTLQATYLFSKSTAVYAAVTHTWHSAVNFVAVSTLAEGVTDQTGVAVGIRHTF